MIWATAMLGIGVLLMASTLNVVRTGKISFRTAIVSRAVTPRKFFVVLGVNLFAATLMTVGATIVLLGITFAPVKA